MPGMPMNGMPNQFGISILFKLIVTISIEDKYQECLDKEALDKCQELVIDFQKSKNHYGQN